MHKTMLEKFPQILIIPIDNRPVCYDLLKNIAGIFNGIKLFMPDKSILGDLNNCADIIKLKSWAKEIIENNDIDIALLSMDTIAYGGLISSRRTSANFSEIKACIDNFLEIFQFSKKKIKTYTTSSIMRISDNYYNEEEKSYWATYGKELFKYSYLSHQLLQNYDLELEAELIKLSKKIPFEIIEDYLDTRKRNFEINSYYIDLVKKNILDFIVFSQDDTAQFGLNIEEKELLYKQAKKELVEDKIYIKTGADEMLATLMARALMEFYNETINIYPFFIDNNAKKIISMYEDKTIQKSVSDTLTLTGATESSNIQDINLIINTPIKIQNELCLGIYKDENNKYMVDKLIEYLATTKSQYAIADIKNANGADNYFVNEYLKIQYDDEKFLGYAAWNTTGNTLGTTISCMLVKILAKKIGCYNQEAFKIHTLIRYLDDWAYQANVRKNITKSNSFDKIYEQMTPFKERIENYLNFCKNIDYILPWNRFFEIEIQEKTNLS